MWKLLGLILPVMVPSWRFFRTVEASPRIQWALVPRSDGPAHDWREVHPRPDHVPFRELLLRLVWNPARNEALFLVSCAERLQHTPSLEIIAEIQRRVVREIARHPAEPNGRDAVFRLIFVNWGDGTLTETEVFRSDRFSATGDVAR